VRVRACVRACVRVCVYPAPTPTHPKHPPIKKYVYEVFPKQKEKGGKKNKRSVSFTTSQETHVVKCAVEYVVKRLM
jgi:hypothetical protein